MVYFPILVVLALNALDKCLPCAGQYLREGTGASQNNSSQLRRSLIDQSSLPMYSDCAIITSLLDIVDNDINAYALRMADIFQLWMPRVIIVVEESNKLQTAEEFKVIGRKLHLHVEPVVLVRVPRISRASTEGLCKTRTMHGHIGLTPIPSMAGISNHGIYLPIIDERMVARASSRFKPNEKKLWLSYDQIWLPTWGLQVPYNNFVYPIIEFASQSGSLLLWPGINGVVVTHEALKDAEIPRARMRDLIHKGLGEGRLRKNFHRLPGVTSPLPEPRTKPARYAAVIYEGRVHSALDAVVRNIMNNVVPRGEWDLHIFHSNGNEKFVKSLFSAMPWIHFHNADNSEISISQYNVLLTGNFFWKIFEHYERVLIFQTDSVFLRQMDPAHLAYDYVGAPWCLQNNFPAQAHLKAGNIKAENMVSVGNGGFSLRNPAVSMKCINEYAPKPNLGKNDLPEDMFFVICMTALNANIAPPSVAHKFAVEVTPCEPLGKDHTPLINTDTSAMHAAWFQSGFRPGEFEQLLSRYEERRNSQA